MKAKETKMGVVQIGYDKYVLPLEKAYQLHALMGEALRQDYEYIGGNSWQYIHDMSKELTVEHIKDPTDMCGKTTMQITNYWNHQKARAKLIPDEAFAPQTWSEYEESKNDNPDV